MGLNAQATHQEPAPAAPPPPAAWLGRAGYGALFVVVLPAALVGWAHATRGWVRLPVPLPPVAGYLVAALGLAVLLGGMLALVLHGRGLPMNAFPPPRFVRSGVYRLFAHPIYVGAVAICAGASAVAGSASGFWLVTPSLALACASLVLGHERPDLHHRFGPEARAGLLARTPVGLRRVLLAGPRLVWAILRRGAELVANSWREWRVGPVRIINHGLWGGLAAGVGMVIIVALAGAPLAPYAVVVWACALVGAGLWAQLVEGSPQLLRPYGYYGGVLGAVVGFGVVALAGGDAWRIAGAYAVATPAIQALGRVRCLVQGCCHGHPCPEWLGIRYHHPRSRVVRVPGLAGRPVHPTQLYSILWCGLWLAAMLGLWSLSLPLPALLGSSFFLSGVGRFAEEAYRGEPQTPMVLGLRLYQWMAVGSALAGAALTCVPGPAAPPAAGGFAAWAVLLVFAVSGAALGVDFPEGTRRFSRLA
jgi:phosphatidylglycerol:prolipoprotein diacylglycerol transferase